MSDTTGAGVGMATGVTRDEAEPQTDQGVPVGAADAEADAERASGASQEPDTNEEYLDRADDEAGTDQGVPVGAADAEQDRLNASSDE